MSIFSIGIMLNFQSLFDYFKNIKTNEILSQLKLDNSILGVITQSFN